MILTDKWYLNWMVISDVGNTLFSDYPPILVNVSENNGHVPHYLWKLNVFLLAQPNANPISEAQQFYYEMNDSPNLHQYTLWSCTEGSHVLS